MKRYLIVPKDKDFPARLSDTISEPDQTHFSLGAVRIFDLDLGSEIISTDGDLRTIEEA